MESCGAEILAKALKKQLVDVVFGVVGIPVVEIAEYCMKEGIKYIGMRNELSAAYAAGVYGYLNGRPGVCLCVSGPGLIHCISGLANAWSNRWPMLLISGSCEDYLEGTGAFQECPQLQSVAPFVKCSFRVTSLDRIPFLLEKTMKTSFYGVPGPVYLELPANVITDKTDSPIGLLPPIPDAPRVFPDPISIESVLDMLSLAERPLVILGKGAAYAKAESYALDFVEKSNIPFLTTPMAKGLISDYHKLCFSSARTVCLKSADVILLVGARLNWMLHFGFPPRFSSKVKLIQVDICPEELGNNKRADINILSDAGLFFEAIASRLSRNIHPNDSLWLSQLRESSMKNQEIVKKLSTSDEIPMQYYSAFGAISPLIEQNPSLVIVSEGANTMDISRSLIPNIFPRSRLDAGTFGTMGVGLGFAIAAAIYYGPKGRRVLHISGDSAFGFSGMELETIARYKLPIVVLILNNNGIYSGLDEISFNEAMNNTCNGVPILPSTSYIPNARYDTMATAFGGDGYFVRSKKELFEALQKALYSPVFSVINCMISPTGTRKQQEFSWLTTSKSDRKESRL